MPATKVKLDPEMTIGEKVVLVGPLSYEGLQDVLDTFAEADLPLPNLENVRVREWIDRTEQAMLKQSERQIKAAESAGGKNGGSRKSAAADAELTGMFEWATLYGLIVELILANMDTLKQWILRHPKVVTALVLNGSNLGPEDITQLSAGEFMRVARACWDALVADGFFGEAAGFFGGLLSSRTNKPEPAGPSAAGPPSKPSKKQ